MNRTLWAVLCLAACSTPQGREYQRGTFVPPPAPSVRPGVGAPVVGQPRASATVTRSHHKRVLPPQKGPGLWSGDSKASAGTTGPVVLVAGVEVALPDGVDDFYARQCAKTINKTIAVRGNNPPLWRWSRQLNESQRQCIVAKAMADCLGLWGDHYATQPRNSDRVKAMHVSEVAAMDFVSRSCPPVGDDPLRLADAFIGEFRFAVQQTIATAGAN